MSQKQNTVDWITKGFEQFRAGTFGNGGQNLYVSAKGVLQRIFQFDLTRNGYFDIPFANCQNHHEATPSTVYLTNGTTCSLPGQGSLSGCCADLTGDGYADLVVAGYYDMAAPFASTDIYFGGPAGYGENRHIRIPTPWAEDCCCGDFKGCGKKALAFSMPIYGVTRIFYQTELGFEWNQFVDLPICSDHISAADLDGDGYDELIVRMRGKSVSVTPMGTITDKVATGARIFWGGPDGINPERFSVLPDFPDSEIRLPHTQQGIQSERERKHDAPRLLKKIKWNGRECFMVSTGKKIILFSGNKDHQLERVMELDVPMALSAAVGDITGNGFDDMAVASREIDPSDPKKQKSFIFWNDGTGLSPDRVTEVETYQACDVDVDDIDGDGFAEVVLCQAGKDMVYTSDVLVFHAAGNGIDPIPKKYHNEDARRVFSFHNPNHTGGLFVVNHFSRSAVGFDKTYIYTGGPDGYSPDRRIDVPCWCAVDSISADLDDDGWTELLVCNNSENSIDMDPGHFIHHFGPDGFEPEKSIALKTDLGWGCACGDFRHSGYLDIATPCSRWKNIRVFQNGPDGYQDYYDIDLHEKGSARWILAADLNKNGYLDLIVPLINTDRTLIFPGGPEGFKWENHYELAVNHGACARVADLSGNGYLDLIIGTHTETPSKGEFKPHQPHHSYLHIYWNGPEGLSENNKAILRCDAADAVCVADFNRDGWLDVFAGSYHGGKERDIHSFLYWNRQGKFSELDRQLIFTHSASGCIAADFNEDGYPDLVVANHKVNGDHFGFSSVWYNSPDGFDKRNRIDLPTCGPHGITSCEPGNALSRGPEEYYISAPRRLPEGTVLSDVSIEAEIPPKCQVLISFRRAESEKQLESAPWSTEIESGNIIPAITGSGDFYQYRLNLLAINSLRTPRVTSVKISLKR